MNFIFDLYGTLVDVKTDEGKPSFWRSICRELGISGLRWRALRREYISLCEAKKLAEDHEIELSDVFADIIRSHGADCTAGELAHIFRQNSTEKLRLFPGVKEMLLSLREGGAGVYLLSNAQACFTRREIDSLGLTELFDGIILSSEVGIKKPSPRVFSLALDRFSLTPEDSIYVGNDINDDVLGATRAGLKTVYIHTEQSRPYTPEDFPAPTYTAKTHAELSDILLMLASGAL